MNLLENVGPGRKILFILAMSTAPFSIILLMIGFSPEGENVGCIIVGLLFVNNARILFSALSSTDIILGLRKANSTLKASEEKTNRLQAVIASNGVYSTVAANTQIGTYKWSHPDATTTLYIKDNTYVGYMYGTRYTFSSKSPGNLATSYKYGIGLKSERVYGIGSSIKYMFVKTGSLFKQMFLTVSYLIIY